MHDTTTSALGQTSDDRFDREVLGTDAPVLVEFLTTWCGNCRRFAPTLAKVAAEYAGRVPVVQVNADENPELVRRYRVSSTPTLVLIADRRTVGTLVGAQPEGAVRALIATAAAVRPSDEPGSVPQWALGDACTLPTPQQPLREAEFAALFATALRRVDRPSPTWLRLELDPRDEVATTTRDLIARESACCSFFDFQLTTADAGLTLDVRVPDAQIEVLDGLARQAGAAERRTDRSGDEPMTRALRSGQLATAAGVNADPALLRTPRTTTRPAALAGRTPRVRPRGGHHAADHPRPGAATAHRGDARP